MRDDLFAPVEEKLKSDSAHALLVESFRRQFRQLAEGRTGLIPQDFLGELGEIPALAGLPEGDPSLIAKSVVIKLNGGLGTTMGLEQAKSLLPAREGYSFLDIIANQVLHLRSAYEAELPLLLMNSFSTDRDSLDALSRHPKLADQPVPLSFLQNRVPKLLADSLAPVRWSSDPEKEWCPPGHGDLYVALRASGILDQLLRSGFEFAFISNADNLGATLDARILSFMAAHNIPFLMEVTERTEADRKGGHLARLKDGTLLLREIAQCPESELADFQNLSRHRYFNTNNLWINLHAVDRLLPLELPAIVNRKTVDPRDKTSPAVIQLETAMGTAIGVIPGAAALRVTRARFAPVKTTDDLLGVWSDAYELTPEWHVRLKPGRAAPPIIKLDPQYYKLIDDFRRRFPRGAPSLIDCESLSIEGDHVFGRGVRIQHRVVIHASAPREISDDATLSGK